MRKRGTTLVETVLAMALTALVVGVLAAIYGFTMVRLGHATANYGATAEAARVAEAIAATVRDARTCSTVTSGGVTALKCVMPANALDKDADGAKDGFLITGVNRRGLERSVSGTRVWFYLASSSGVFGTSGTIPFRAERSDDGLPTGANVDWDFSYASETKQRYQLVTSLNFAVDSAAQTVAVTVGSNGIARDERSSSSGFDVSQGYSHTETRTVAWRNWRK